MELNMDQEVLITRICNVVMDVAKRQNAVHNGEMNDGGARATESKLEHWLDGINFAQTGCTSVYNWIANDIKKKNDPDYEQYLKLKSKFEKT